MQALINFAIVFVLPLVAMGLVCCYKPKNQ